MLTLAKIYCVFLKLRSTFIHGVTFCGVTQERISAPLNASDGIGKIQERSVVQILVFSIANCVLVQCLGFERSGLRLADNVSSLCFDAVGQGGLQSLLGTSKRSFCHRGKAEMTTNTANNGQVQAILVVMTLKSLSLRHHTRVPRPQIKQTSRYVLAAFIDE